MLRRHRILVIVCIGLFTVLPSLVAAAKLAQTSSAWQLLNPLPVAEDLHATVYGGDRYVAVGDAGTVLMSVDGLGWRPVDSGISEDLFDIAWTGEEFVAVGSAGVVLVSPDGEKWSRHDAGLQSSLRGVATGASGLIASRTLITTTSGDLGEHLPGSGPVGGARSHLVNIADQGARTDLGLVNPSNQEVLADVEVFDGDGSSLAASQISVPPLGLRQLNDVFALMDTQDVTNAWGTVDAGEQLLVGYASVVNSASGDADTQVFPRSYPEWSWSAVSALPEDLYNPRSLALGSDRFVVLGWNWLISSEDGSEWTRIEVAEDMRSVSWNGDQFVAVGGAISSSSNDGVSWSVQPWSGPPLNALAWNGVLWVAVGDQGTVAWSVDGSIWASADLGGADLLDVVWTGEAFVAVSRGEMVALSADGLTWTTHSVEPRDFDSVTFGAGLLVATDFDPFWSEDGLTWHRSEASGRHERVTWTGERFVASGPGTPSMGRMSTSLDGKVWQQFEPQVISGDVFMYPKNMVWDGSKLVAQTYLWSDGPSVITWLVNHEPALTLPGLAHSDGLNGASWMSDVQLVNHGDVSGNVVVELYQRGHGNPSPSSVTVTVEARHATRLEDVAVSLFGVHGGAALRLKTNGPWLAAAARTTDAARQGTRGQHISASSDAEAVWFLEEGRIIGLDHSVDTSTGRRTNLGVMSRCVEEMHVEVELFDALGNLLGDVTLNLDPFEYKQITGVFERVTDEGVENGFAVLTTSHRRCSFFSYASSVDNGTGDALWIPATRRAQHCCDQIPKTNAAGPQPKAEGTSSDPIVVRPSWLQRAG